MARRLLILGGGRFVGHALVSAAQSADWSVTAFNRGRTSPPASGTRFVQGDRYNPADLARLAQHGPWDVVLDTSGYVPRNTLEVCRALRPVAGRYIFLSTVSVYADWPKKPLSEGSPLLPSSADAGPDYGSDTEDGPTQYGYQKAGAEAAVLQAFEEQDSTILRPGVVLGPREYVGRLPWWLRRISAGGTVLAPGDPRRNIQPIDVRDLAEFALSAANHGLSGTFNLTAPMDRDTFGSLLESCKLATSANADLCWAPDEILLRSGVRQWSEMPLWRTYDGVWMVDSTRAFSAGFRCRDLSETVLDTWAWLKTSSSTDLNDRAAEVGLSSAKEAIVLASLREAESI